MVAFPYGISEDDVAVNASIVFGPSYDHFEKVGPIGTTEGQVGRDAIPQPPDHCTADFLIGDQH